MGFAARPRSCSGVAELMEQAPVQLDVIHCTRCNHRLAAMVPAGRMLQIGDVIVKPANGRYTLHLHCLKCGAWQVWHRTPRQKAEQGRHDDNNDT
jgi:hypothetical protein